MKVLREKIQIPEGHSFRVLSWSRSLSEVECVVGPGKTVKVDGEGTHWHFHVEMELTLFTRGEGTRFVGDHIGSFAAGDLVLLGEKLPHYWHAREGSSGISVQWHFPESHPFWAFPENLALLKMFQRASHGLHLGGRAAAEVAHLMQALTQASGVQSLAILLNLLGRLAAATEGERTLLSARSFALSAESRHQEAIAKSVRHLIAHFREEVRLEDLLRISGMSRPTFAREFKKHSGRTFSGFLNRLRLQAACRELQESERTVLDIALACGFTQVSFFNRIFRRLMKCSPTGYRSRRKKKRD